jgi:hypothetical protein
MNDDDDEMKVCVLSACINTFFYFHIFFLYINFFPTKLCFYYTFIMNFNITTKNYEMYVYICNHRDIYILLGANILHISFLL